MSICKLFLMGCVTSVLTRHSFVDRDMFMRYMGGGIGHLEQFPPAHNDDEDTTAHGGNAAGADDFNEGELDCEMGGSSDGWGGDDGKGEDDDSGHGSDDPDDEDDGGGLGGDGDEEDEDAEEDLDEETGNVY